MPTATQTPFLREPAKQQGRHLFRKQLLPLGHVDHPKHGRIDFGRDTLAEIEQTFKAGAYDVCPFLLANEKNEHHDDPERVRGEIKGVELTDDGLFGLVETGDRGAQLLSENPKLPVSVRIVTPESGPHKGKSVLAHVLGTLDPVAKGMKPWEAIEASADWEVVDLTSDDGVYKESVSTDAQTAPGTDALSDEEKGLLSKVFGKILPAKPEGDGKPEGTAKDGDTVTVAEAEQILADALEVDDKEPVAASLSPEDRKAVELAQSTAKEAKDEARALKLELGKAKLEARFQGYLKDGVPPAVVNLAKEKLSGHDDTVIELAADKSTPTAEALFAVLDEAKGTIDFSERGTTAAADDEQTEAARKQAEDAVKSYTGAA